MEHLARLGVSSLPCGISIIAYEQAHAQPSGQGLAMPHERIVYCNAAYQTLCGCSEQQLLGTGFDQLAGAATDRAQVDRLRHAMAANQSETVQLLCYHSSGKTFWNSISISPIRVSLPPCSQQQYHQSFSDEPSHQPGSDSVSNSSGQGQQQNEGCSSPTAFFIAMHQDVSSLVLEREGYRLRDQALHSCSEGITIADPNQPDAPIVYVNDAFLEMTGYSREEVLGRNCRFLQGPDTCQDALGRLKNALAQHQKCTVQLLNYRKDGRKFWNLLSVTPVFDSNMRLTSYIGVQTDITELVIVKEEERRASEAKDAAEMAMEAKSMFLANMSHEIRTPLNGIMATAQLLLTSMLTPEQRDLAETILESGNNLLGVLGDILDFSKLDQGEVQLQRQPLCIRTAVEACIEMVAQDARKKGLSVAYLLDDGVFERPLLGDPVRFRQILVNLLANAVKFTDSGEVVVRVQVEPPGFRQQQQQQQQPPGSHRMDIQNLRGCFGTRSCRQSPSGAYSVLSSSTPEHDSSGSNSSGNHSSSSGNVSDEDGSPTLHQVSSSSLGTTAPSHAPQPDLIHVSVSDTGIGISQAQAAKLFQCFNQASETMSRRYGGTGLGLAISRRLAELMHGSCWVDSELGHGSTFHFTIAAEWLEDAGDTGSTSAASNCVGELPPESFTVSRDYGSVSSSSSSANHFGMGGLSTADHLAGRLKALQQDQEHASASGSSRSSQEQLQSPVVPSPATGASGQVSPDPYQHSPTRWGATGTEAQARQQQQLEEAAAAAHLSNMSLQHLLTSHSPSGIKVRNSTPGDDRYASLRGRRVLVDLAHEPTAMQILQSCRQLGMQVTMGNARSPAAASVDRSHAPQLPAASTTEEEASRGFDMAVVGVERAVQAIRTVWKGRPLVVLGDRSLLPRNLHPLAVFVSLPAKHAALATALLKSMVLLRWLPNGAAPKLTDETISKLIIKDLKHWRQRQGSFMLDYAESHHRTSLDNSALCRQSLQSAASGQQAAPQPDTGKLMVPPAAASQLQPDVEAEAAAAALAGAGQSAVAPVAAAPAGVAPQQGVTSTMLPMRGSSWAPSLFSHAQQRQMLQQQLWQQQEQLQPQVQQPASGPQYQQYQQQGLQQQLQQQHQRHALELQRRQSQERQQPQQQSLGQQHQQRQQQPLPMQQQQQQPLATLRILIAEDNKINQKVVLKVLQRICSPDCLPDVVENGLQVLTKLEEKSYDLILMDIHMPEMDGLEATRQICERYPRPEDRPRIVALSADSMQELHDRCREAGIEEFIVKPFKIEDLKRVMNICKPGGRSPALVPAVHVPLPAF